MLFVIDSTDEEKLLFAREELSKIAKDESLKGVPVMLFYNKSDMVEEVKSKEHLNEKLEIKAIS
jgi:GTPase SAR1 family protein